MGVYSSENGGRYSKILCKCKKNIAFISLNSLIFAYFANMMNLKVRILNKQAVCISISEQTNGNSTLSEVDNAILCGKTFGKEEKKCAENLQVSDFVLNTHRSRRI